MFNKGYKSIKKQKILVIDNYDSFTYNLVQLLGMNIQEVLLYRNDEITVSGIKRINPDKILISPGPGRPEDSKVTLLTIEKFYDKIPILGVCLGHQAIGLVFGNKVINAPEPVHGKTSMIFHDGLSVFNKIKNPFQATRYHSLIVDRNNLSNDLLISAQSEDSTIMGLRHKHYPVEGIQFHPESILTKVGSKIISNWLRINP